MGLGGFLLVVLLLRFLGLEDSDIPTLWYQLYTKMGPNSGFGNLGISLAWGKQEYFRQYYDAGLMALSVLGREPVGAARLRCGRARVCQGLQALDRGLNDYQYFCLVFPK